MYHLKLIKALSYTGILSATKKNPDVYTEDKSIADAAVETGYFQIADAVKDATNGEEDKPGSEGEKPKKTLEEMTAAELETYAAYHNVSLKGVRNKADMIAKLKAELGEEETDEEVNYGSPTMQELMEQ